MASHPPLVSGESQRVDGNYEVLMQQLRKRGSSDIQDSRSWGRGVRMDLSYEGDISRRMESHIAIATKPCRDCIRKLVVCFDKVKAHLDG
jgi:hypothetical protein